MKILNLYACLGGNRYKWNEVKNDIQVTAVEWDEELARLYQERFPNDKVIVADAHQYLLDHYKEYDFIWSSPPCPTHSRARGWNTKVKTMYPDMKLYEEIILLETVAKGKKPRFKGKYVVENVIPYYEPLLPAQKRHRHMYWTNFRLPTNLSNRKSPLIGQGKNEIDKFSKFHDYDFKKYKGKQFRNKIARNLVDYEAGKTILEIALEINKNKYKQTKLF
jgi:DNA (cytosine-5)-methyltransferase 1